MKFKLLWKDNAEFLVNICTLFASYILRWIFSLKFGWVVLSGFKFHFFLILFCFSGQILWLYGRNGAGSKCESAVNCVKNHLPYTNLLKTVVTQLRIKFILPPSMEILK